MSETFDESAPTLKFGTVSAVDEATAQVRVRLPDVDNMRTDWLPVLTRKTKQDKDYWLPDIGEHIAVLLDANGEDGLVLGAVFSDADSVPIVSRDKWHKSFADGASLEYDRAAHKLTVTGGIQHVVVEVGADVLVKSGTKVTVDTPDTEFTGNVTVNGKLTYKGGMSGSGGSTAAAIEGNVQVSGNVTASGTIMDGSGNSNHHSH
ncbi:MAG: phage baseplate assembly protein V [Burkholderiaceae bacterium]|jgi:phage baseplate assembly protein V|nr:phage baseplate assembly protein V [Burkholderiaceae bacterium]